jgi:hypothetical protein
VRLVGENAFEQLSSVRADGLRPMNNPRRRQFQVGLMGTRLVLCDSHGVPVTVCAQVRRYALALIEDLDNRWRRAYLAARAVLLEVFALTHLPLRPEFGMPTNVCSHHKSIRNLSTV